MTVIFFGSSSFSVPLLRSIHQSVDCVVTKKTKPKGRGYVLQDNEVKREALSLRIPLLEIDSFRDEQVRQIGDLNPDLLVVASFGLIIPKWFLAIPTIGAINIHPSLLPRYRGPSPIQWAIWNGERETGITIMKMNERMDAGDILLHETVPIGEADDSETLSDQLSMRAAKILPDVLENARCNGATGGIPQHDDEATYTPMITKEMGKIDWHMGSTEIMRQVRALVPWPTAYGLLDGRMLKIFKACPSSGRPVSKEVPGTVLAVSTQGIEIATGEGSLVLAEIQLENRKRMAAVDFARGYRDIIGRRLS
jgi:methionyl-tRNA formyltransferase